MITCWSFASLLLLNVPVDQASPSWLLDQYKSSARKMDPISFSGVASRSRRDAGSSLQTPTGKYVFSLVRSGRNWKLDSEILFWVPDKAGGRRESFNSAEILLLENAEYYVGRTKNRVLDSLSLNHKGRLQVPGGQEMSAIFGVLDGNDSRTIADLLDSSKLSVHIDTVDGQQAERLQGDGPWGVHILWLDPKLQYLPRRVIQRKEKDSLYAPGKKIGDMVYHNHPYYPDAHFRRIEQVIEVRETDSSLGAPVWKRFTINSREEFENGAFLEWRTEIECNKFSNAVDSASFRLTTPIPEGRKVDAVDEPGISYEWRGGRAVKTFDEAAAAEMKKQEFVAPADPTRFVVPFALAVAAAAVVLVAIAVWRRRT